MHGVVHKIRLLALALGAPGLFLAAFLDSSFVPLPEIIDLLVVWMITHHKRRLVLYVISATLGSLAGCLVMYYLGRKGGEALVRRHFASARVERAMAVFRRHGIMAVLIPSMLPPPAPFKIFVVLAGIVGISVGRFSTAIIIGRGSRYLALGLLAVEYGDRTFAFLRTHGVAVSFGIIAVLGAGFIGYLLWNRSRPAEVG
jgi:membrane protein YqaA with SNARE-associated domain